MNIYTQACGLIIVLVLLYFYSKQPTMGLITEKKYLRILYASLCCTFFDILSVVLIVNSELYRFDTVAFIGRLYLISLVVVCYQPLSYCSVDFLPGMTENGVSIYHTIYRGSAVAAFVIIMTHPINFMTKFDVAYTYGPATLCTYIVCSFYILTTLFATKRFRRYIKPKRWRALRFWMVMLLAAGTLEFFFPTQRIISFVVGIGAMIVFVEIENPETNISKRSGLFNSNSMIDYYEYLFSENHDFGILMLAYATTSESSIDAETINYIVDELDYFLYGYKNGKVFTTNEGYFTIVFDDISYMEEARSLLENKFDEFEMNPKTSNAKSLMHPYFITIPSAFIADNIGHLTSLIDDFTPMDVRNCTDDGVVIDESAIEYLENKKRIEDMVVDALLNDRVEVHYQPIYCVESGLFSSAEALVRIRLSDGTLVPPDTFIPIAEDTGRILALSDAVFRKSFSFINSYRLSKLGVNYIELNLSLRHGEDPLFPQKFKEVLEQYHISGTSVNLEITETASLQKKDGLLRTMEQLRDYGCHFSLDDFGSGSSNLNYIIDMPVDIVKFGKTLTGSYMENDKAKAVVTSVTKMAHALDMKVVAEGIETEEQCRVMSELGIDFIQGYYFSHPLPEKEYIQFIQNNNLKLDSEVG
ncbi:MAG: EAL domain-containing protein [Pseudobutyrivibrio sp.]|nr:EAL domain-containing protein [Pseudobutyrivibrio sp.]